MGYLRARPDQVRVREGGGLVQTQPIPAVTRYFGDRLIPEIALTYKPGQVPDSDLVAFSAEPTLLSMS